MKNVVGNLLLELGVFTFFGILYYFYQRRKIIHYENNKKTIVMEMILQSCLADKIEEAQPELDQVIEALDDYLQNKTLTPPTALLDHFLKTSECSDELREVVSAGLKELEPSHGQK